MFLTFEGIDGCGKTTLARSVYAALRAQKSKAILTREPGGTPLGEQLRTILLDGAQSLSPLAQTLLHFAIREQNLATIVRPALQQGKIVLCDRFTLSTWAYQHGGLGVDADIIAHLEKEIVGSTQPDWIFILDISLEESQRRCKQRNRGQNADRYEAYGPSFLEKVRQIFRTFRLPHTVILDGTQEIKYLVQQVLGYLKT